MTKKCYNCQGAREVSIAGEPICPDCQRTVMHCHCGSKADLLNQFKIIMCPTCKGTGKAAPKQLRLSI